MEAKQTRKPLSSPISQVTNHDKTKRHHTLPKHISGREWDDTQWEGDFSSVFLNSQHKPLSDHGTVYRKHGVHEDG